MPTEASGTLFPSLHSLLHIRREEAPTVVVLSLAIISTALAMDLQSQGSELWYAMLFYAQPVILLIGLQWFHKAHHDNKRLLTMAWQIWIIASILSLLLFITVLYQQFGALVPAELGLVSVQVVLVISYLFTFVGMERFIRDDNKQYRQLWLIFILAMVLNVLLTINAWQGGYFTAAHIVEVLFEGLFGVFLWYAYRKIEATLTRTNPVAAFTLVGLVFLALKAIELLVSHHFTPDKISQALATFANWTVLGIFFYLYNNQTNSSARPLNRRKLRTSAKA